MPRRYGNDGLWDRIRDPDDVLPIPHVHMCTLCYEYEPCEMGCALEPDLGLHEGLPCGSPTPCDTCEAARAAVGRPDRWVGVPVERSEAFDAGYEGALEEFRRLQVISWSNR